MSITNKLNQIKNAIYGKDVRGAIHDAIKECYDDASVNHDNANMEVKMARGTYNTLNDRLNKADEIQAQTNAQLSQISSICCVPLSNGADDTQTIQQIVDNMTNGGRIIFTSGQTYIIKSPIFVRNSNITFDFNGSKIEWHGTEDLGQDNAENRTNAVFTIVGNRSSDWKTISALKKDNKEKRYDGIALQVNDTQSLNVGDYIHISVSTREWGAWDKNYGDYTPLIETIAKVVGIENDIVYTDYTTPFEFESLYSGSYAKITPCENIFFDGLMIEDKTPEFYPSNNSERSNFVGFINAKYCANLSVYNLKGKRHKFPAILLRYVYKGSFDNIESHQKSSSGAGLGYIMQVNYSTMIHIRNVQGENVSPVVDFSGANHCSVTNAKSQTGGINPITNSQTTSKFTLHGICEHDICFNNCIGEMNVGHGIDEFMILCENITFNNCRGHFKCEWVHNLKMLNCELTVGYYSGNYRYSNAEFIDCKIKHHGRYHDVINSTRGHYKYGQLIYRNCQIELTNGYNASSGRSFNATNFYLVRYEYCHIRNNSDLIYDLGFDGNREVILSNNRIYNCNGVYKRTETTFPDYIYEISRNFYTTDVKFSGTNMCFNNFSKNSLNDVDCVIDIENNIFKSSNNSQAFITHSSNCLTNNSTMKVHGNTFINVAGSNNADFTNAGLIIRDNIYKNFTGNFIDEHVLLKTFMVHNIQIPRIEPSQTVIISIENDAFKNECGYAVSSLFNKLNHEYDISGYCENDGELVIKITNNRTIAKGEDTGSFSILMFR